MIYSSWAKQTELGNFRTFLPFIPPKNPKNQNSEKWKNLLEISSFYICALKIAIMWCMVPEILIETDKIFVLSALLPPMDPENHNFQKNRKKHLKILSFYKHMMYGSSDMECNGQNFLSFWTIFSAESRVYLGIPFTCVTVNLD